MKKFKIIFSIVVLAAGIIVACSDESLKPIPLILTVSTYDPTSVTGSSASVKGWITSNGGKTVTNYGVCYATKADNASLSNPDSVIAGASIGADGSYTISITGLTGSITYYAKAYATNSAGTAYGNVVTFTTTPVPPNPPTVLSTAVASDVTTTTALSGGNIAYGGAAITEMGVCITGKIAGNPTLADSVITVSSPGAGPFIANITGLAPSKTYHVRAYAKNAGGTSYGNDISFKTND